MHSFVFTCGDVNGIGPEIVIKSFNRLTKSHKQDKLFFICPENIFNFISKKIKLQFSYSFYDQKIKTHSSKNVNFILLPDCKKEFGKPTPASGKTAYEALNVSYKLLKNKTCDAVITAPVSKTALHLAGLKFPGQTEMFAKWSGTKNYMMIFLSDRINLALYSIHIPLKKVSLQLNKKHLEDSLTLLVKTVKTDLGKKNPKIAVLGLNPHAGESGIIGTEEEEIIIPVIKKFSKKYFIGGPFSPDAYFGNKIFLNYDMTLAMYHDQGLIPFKYINFGKGVNFTAGLPIVRTSPDHGVAYDIAADFIADESSMLQAFYYAKKIVKNRQLTR